MSTDIPLTRNSLLMLVYTDLSKIDEALSIIRPHLRSHLTESESRHVRRIVTSLAATFRTKYKKCKNLSYFEMKHEEWLNVNLSFPSAYLKNTTSAPRTPLPFSEKGKRAQQKQIAKISDNQAEEFVPLIKATTRTLKKRGYNDAAAILSEITKSPARAETVRRLISQTPSNQESFTPEEALRLFLDLSLTKYQYQHLRTAVKNKGHKNLFPAYNVVLDANAKNDCRPTSSTSLNFKDTQVGIPLQSFLGHTTQRLVQMHEEVPSSNLTTTLTNETYTIN